ncbi:MAG: MFS transporter [Pseudomonadota bacterium]
MHWPGPVLVGEAPADRPVMIQVAYAVAPADEAAFLAKMHALAASRRRGGGYRWSLMRDAAEATRFVESWWEASWLDHQRQHARVSRDDQALQAEIRALQVGGAPVVRHFVWPGTHADG